MSASFSQNTARRPKGLVTAGVQSGSGKTTLTLALIAAWRRRGLKVQAFKVGPDFIDPGHHARLSGRPSHNLDGWMLSREENRAIFNRYAFEADLVLVEGVMGLYDGYDGRSEAGSTAEMAKLLGLPVLLCADARAAARSLAAVALGFASFDPDLPWLGLVANRVGSPAHLELLSQALIQKPSLPFLGGLVRNEAVAMGERHLGLITADELPLRGEDEDRLIDWVEQGLDLDRILEDLPEIEPDRIVTPAAVPSPSRQIRLGVARDEAFCFYYQENLRRLEEAGAELFFFSPIRDQGLPPDLDGLYFGGGYPELFARELAANHEMRTAVRDFGRSGRPIYAECGGMMYLGEKIIGSTDPNDARSRPMTGLLPLTVRMLGRLKSLGYREVVFTKDTPLGLAGTTARGHEFHYSEITDSGPVHSVYKASGRRGPLEGVHGFQHGAVLASYIHLHFGSNPDLASNLVASCRRPHLEITK